MTKYAVVCTCETASFSDSFIAHTYACSDYDEAVMRAACFEAACKVQNVMGDAFLYVRSEDAEMERFHREVYKLVPEVVKESGYESETEKV